jgi:MYXO-CTERM domain-containing protein
LYVLTGAVYTTGSFGSSTLFEIAVVPAPGAVALIGAAGLISGRRRRN